MSISPKSSGNVAQSQKQGPSAWLLGSLSAVALVVLGIAVTLLMHPKPSALPVSAGPQNVMSLAQRMRSDPGSLTEADRRYIHNLPPQQRAQFLSQLSGSANRTAQPQ